MICTEKKYAQMHMEFIHEMSKHKMNMHKEIEE